MNIAIILAAGRSKRVKRGNKIFLKIKRRPLISYTIEVFEKHPQIQKIVLVARKINFKKFFSLIKKEGLKKVARVVRGGKERQDSAFEGLKAVKNLGAKSGDLILFHNGANPLVSQNEITNVIRAAKEYKAALVAQPARDTIKERDKNGFVVRTVNRGKIFLAQTPQVIEYKLAKKAFEKARLEKFYGTDDVSLVERLGKKVKIVPASSTNIKVTYPEDLEFVNSYIRTNS